MVSLYRQKLNEMGVLEKVKEEILEVAERNGLRTEIEELLTRDIEL